MSGWKIEKEANSVPRESRQLGLVPLSIITPKEWFFGGSARILTTFLLCFVGAVMISLLVLFNKGCPLEDFQCWDSTCIPKEQFCDGKVLDCSRGEDEEEAYCQMRGQLNSLKNVFKDLEGEHICDLEGVPGFPSRKMKLMDKNRIPSKNGRVNSNTGQYAFSAKTKKLSTKFSKRTNKKLLGKKLSSSFQNYISGEDVTTDNKDVDSRYIKRTNSERIIFDNFKSQSFTNHSKVLSSIIGDKESNTDTTSARVTDTTSASDTISTSNANTTSAGNTGPISVRDTYATSASDTENTSASNTNTTSPSDNDAESVSITATTSASATYTTSARDTETTPASEDVNIAGNNSKKVSLSASDARDDVNVSNSSSLDSHSRAKRMINRAANISISDVYKSYRNENRNDYISVIKVRKKKDFLTNKSIKHLIFPEKPEVSPSKSEKSLNNNNSRSSNQNNNETLELFLSNDTEYILKSFMKNFLSKFSQKIFSLNVHNSLKEIPNEIKRKNYNNVANPYLEIHRRIKTAIWKDEYFYKVFEEKMIEFYRSLQTFLAKAHSLKISPDISYKIVPNFEKARKIKTPVFDKFVQVLLSVISEILTSNFSHENYTETTKRDISFPSSLSRLMNSTLSLKSSQNVTLSKEIPLQRPYYDKSKFSLPLPEVLQIFKDSFNSSFSEFINELTQGGLKNLTYFAATQNETLFTTERNRSAERAIWEFEPAMSEMLVNAFEDVKKSNHKKAINISERNLAIPSTTEDLKNKSVQSSGAKPVPHNSNLLGVSTTLSYRRSNTSTKYYVPEVPPSLPPNGEPQRLNSRPECSCELRTVVKCSNVTSVPANISGGMTKLVLSNNRIKDINYDVMRNYTRLQQGLYLQNNLIVSLPSRVFSAQKMLKRLFLHENLISELNADSCIGLRQLEVLHLYENNLTNVDLHCFQHTPVLHTLLLSRNKLTLIDDEFPSLLYLKFLDLQRNRIPLIQKQLFAKLSNLKTLSLQHNRIASIHPDAFENLKNLEDLDLSNNKILRNVAFIFRHLSALQSLNLRGVQLDSTIAADYQNLTSLKRVYFPRLRYCAFVEQVDHCEPRSDGVTSKEDLMQSLSMRLCVWLVAFVTLTGNVAVILIRGISRNDEEVMVIFIKNLASADFLMGIYLVIVGVQDQLTRGNFFRYVNWWTSSFWCTLAGCLALVSSEASVFILAFMSLQRYLYITRTFRGNELTIRFARKSLMVIWFTSFLIAVFPVIEMTSFYGMNAMCFPLHISEPYYEGWQFSAFVFLGLNSFSMVVIICSYLGLFINITITRSKTPLSKKDLSFVLRFLFIVLTDCICWVPVLALKLVALAEIPITGEVYAWLVVLVVPINSALNPVLYTFSTPNFMANMQQTFRKARSSWLRKDSDSQDTVCFSSTRSRHSFGMGRSIQNFDSAVIPPSNSFLSNTNSNGIPPSKSSIFDGIERERALEEARFEITDQTEDKLTIEISDNENSYINERDVSNSISSSSCSPSSPAIRLTCRLKNISSLSLTVVREIKNDEQSFYRKQQYDVSPRKESPRRNIRLPTETASKHANDANSCETISCDTASDMKIDKNGFNRKQYDLSEECNEIDCKCNFCLNRHEINNFFPANVNSDITMNDGSPIFCNSENRTDIFSDFSDSTKVLN